MRFLITGATGFVGANLARVLLQEQSNEVFITARKTSDFSRLVDCQNLLKGISYVDLADRKAVFAAVSSVQPEVIYHIATYGGFPGQADTNMAIQSNLVATMNLLDAAVSMDVQQFINTGSSSEYGIKDMPMKESDICEPLNFYGITKLAATNYCTMLGKNLNYKVCTLRLFSPYGDLEDASRLYPSIKNSLLNGERPKLSRPNSVRDFIPIEKVMLVYKAIIKRKYVCGDIINVGSGRQQTIEQFFKKIASEMRLDVEPIWGEAIARKIEPVRWEADIAKLRSLMGDDFSV